MLRNESISTRFTQKTDAKIQQNTAITQTKRFFFKKIMYSLTKISRHMQTNWLLIITSVREFKKLDAQKQTIKLCITINICCNEQINMRYWYA